MLSQSSTKTQRPGGARVPRASLAVSILRDPDYVVLMSTGKEGQRAFAAFVSIILIAKDLGNDGRFVEPLRVVAEMIRWELTELEKAIACIQSVCKQNGHKPWLTMTASGSRLRVRSFEIWNSPASGWGGKRDGAGRKRLDSKSESSCNQDDTPPQVGIGIGSGVLPEGGAGGNPTPADRFVVQPFVARLWELLPDRVKQSRSKIAAAMVVANQLGHDLDHVIERTVAYYRSPQGLGQYCRLPATFIADGGYDEPTAAWNDRKPKQSTGGSTPAFDTTARDERLAEDARILAEREQEAT